MASEKQVSDGSSVVNLEMIGDDQSDYDINLADPDPHPASRRRYPSGEDEDTGIDFMKVSKSQVASGVASYVWEEGRQRAKKAFSIYGNIDILRPYFDVEPQTVRNRLIHSLVPKLPRAGSQEKVPRELYGPTMVVLTLIALLLFQMKMSGITVQEGTLMGSAFGVCFTYWFGTTGLLWFLAYVCNTHITALQILSLLGYALFGHCVALFLSTTFHPSHSHIFFYFLWLVFGGLSALRVVSILFSRTAGRTQRMIICGVMASVHMLFLLYLHFAYHQIVEDLNYALDSNRAAPEPMRVEQPVEGHGVPGSAHTTAKLVADAVKRVVREAVNNSVTQPIRGADSQPVRGILLDAIRPRGLTGGFNQTLNGTQNHAVRGTI